MRVGMRTIPRVVPFTSHLPLRPWTPWLTTRRLERSTPRMELRAIWARKAQPMRTSTDESLTSTQALDAPRPSEPSRTRIGVL